MTQEQTSGFTHIAVGIPARDNELPSEDEELIVIGAVDGHVTAADASTDDVSAEDMPSADNAAADAPDATAETAGVAVKPSEDDTLGGPMPIAQKVVLALCFVGLIVAAVFIVRYWL